MAFVYKQQTGTGRNSKKQIALVVIVTLTLWMMLKTESGGLSSGSLATITPVLAAVLFFILVAFKKNPFNWISSFGKNVSGKDRMPQMMEDLEQLDDGFHIFPHITLEFFKIDCLVVSSNGIFVVRIPDRTETANTHQMNKEIQKLWQRCHMINMLIKKGYKKQIMPIPLLAVPGADEDTHNGVTIIPPDAIAGWMSHHANPDEDLNAELANGFSFFLSKRYLR